MLKNKKDTKKENKTEETLEDLEKEFSEETSLDTQAEDVLEETYIAKGPLHVPEKLVERITSEGYKLHWVKIYDSNGQLDGKHIRQREMEGYTFLTKEDVPEMTSQSSNFFGEKIDSHGGAIVMGDVALAKIPLKTIDARRTHLEKQTLERSKGIIRDMREKQIKGEYKTSRNNSPRDVNFSS